MVDIDKLAEGWLADVRKGKATALALVAAQEKRLEKDAKILMGLAVAAEKGMDLSDPDLRPAVEMCIAYTTIKAALLRLEKGEKDA